MRGRITSISTYLNETFPPRDQLETIPPIAVLAFWGGCLFLLKKDYNLILIAVDHVHRS